MPQRMFRSDDTDPWLYKYGTGSDGVYSSVGNATDTITDSACTGTSGAYTLSATNPSFNAGDLVFIHQTRGTNFGLYEFNKILSYTAGTITLVHPLTNTYTTGAQVIAVPEYAQFTQNSGHTLTGKLYDGTVGGFLIFFCTGPVLLNGTLNVNTRGHQSRTRSTGGTNFTFYQGDSPTGIGVLSTSANGSGGGGGASDNGNQSGGGGGAGHANNGSDGGTPGNADYGRGGTTCGNADLTLLNLGPAGGEGAAIPSNVSQRGGHGAGSVIILAPKITINTGYITLDGEDGIDGGEFNAGSGGGAGGSCLLKGEDISIGTSRITATKGDGGATGSGTALYGGDGSPGIVHADYANTFSGTSNPSLSTTKDTTLFGSYGFAQILEG